MSGNENLTHVQVRTNQQLNDPPTEQSAGMQRGEAFAHDGVWAGVADFPAGACTGWHHHGDYATYGYITRGSMTVEFGPGGEQAAEVRAGDFVHIPPHVVHRETVGGDGGEGVVVRVGGHGPAVFNVDGPDQSGSGDQGPP